MAPAGRHRAVVKLMLDRSFCPCVAGPFWFDCLEKFMTPTATDNMRFHRVFALLFVLALLACTSITARAQADGDGITLPDGVSFVTRVEGVSEYRLDNGLQVLLAPDASKPNTTVNMTYRVGSRHENYGQTGMAHLLEHMLFRGTPSMPDALAEFSRRGLQANGTTSADRTNYFASFAADPETLDWYIRWQADVMVNAMIAQEDLDAEMTVVRNEMERGENSPFRVLMQKTQAAAFQWHNYGKSTIGARSDVENVDIEQLRAFYREYYQPDNASLIVSGRFEIEDTLGIIADAFAPISRPDRVLPPEYTVEPVQDGERRVTLRREGGSPLIMALYHIPPAGDPDYIPLDLGVSILGDTPSGRLYHALVRNDMATSVFSFAAAMEQPGYALFGAQLEPGMDQYASLQALTDTLDSLADTPFEQQDLDRIRNQWLTGWSRTFADPIHLASALSEAVAVGDWRLFFLHRDQVENATLDDVQAAVNTWLVASNRSEGLYIPTDDPLRAPATQDVDLDALLAGYQGQQGSTAIDAFDPTPANLDAATQRDVLELENGPIHLALLPKPTRGDRVEARLRVNFGDQESLKGQRTVSDAAAALLTRGTTSMTRQEIDDRLNALRATVSFSSGAGSVSASLSTTGEHLPALVELVLHLLRDADFPQEELDEFKRQSNTAISNAMAEPEALAARALARHANPWPQDDIRYVPTFQESLDNVAALDRASLQRFHREFYGAGDIYFTAVGSFDPDAIRSALTNGVQGWKPAPAYTRVPDPWHPVEPEQFHIRTPGKANAFYISAMPVEIRDTDPRFPALYLANYLLGSSETSRLWTRVRTREGLSYNVRSHFDASSYEPSGSWTIYAIFAPENRDRLEAVIQEELKRVLDEGFTQEEVEQGVYALLNYRRLARTRDSVVAGTWMHYLHVDRSFAWSQEIDDALQALSAYDVNRVLREVFDPRKLSTAIAADIADWPPATDVIP